MVGSLPFGLYSQPPPLQLTFFPPGSARFPPGSAGFRWVLPLRRVPLGSAGFQALPVQFRRVLPGFRQQGSCSRLTLQSIARIVQGSCQAFAKVAAIKVKEAVFANARTLCKSAHGKNTNKIASLVGVANLFLLGPHAEGEAIEIFIVQLFHIETYQHVPTFIFCIEHICR